MTGENRQLHTCNENSVSTKAFAVHVRLYNFSALMRISTHRERRIKKRKTYLNNADINSTIIATLNVHIEVKARTRQYIVFVAVNFNKKIIIFCVTVVAGGWHTRPCTCVEKHFTQTSDADAIKWSFNNSHQSRVSAARISHRVYRHLAKLDFPTLCVLVNITYRCIVTVSYNVV